MSRRISIRKIIQTLVTLIAVTGCALAMISADRQQAKHKVKGVEFVVKSPAGVHFLTEGAVRGMLFTGRHVNPYQLSVEQLDERSMEAILRTNPWVKEAQVYTDAERVIHIILTQRVPLVRLFEEDGGSYYLDAALQAMPLSTQYTHYTPVITGVPKLGTDSMATIVKGRIVGLVQQIQRDTFWNAQVSQIEMRRDGGFDLIPVLGKQRIIVGDTARLSEKLANLFAFYKQVQNRVGWDKYNTVDLRYEGQIVASPALPWKAPVDKAISNMNWLQAIMENAPKHESLLGGDAAANADSASIPDQLPTTPKTAKPITVTTTASASKSALVSKQTLSLQAAHNSKTKLPTTLHTSPKNTPRNKQNTPPHAASNR